MEERKNGLDIFSILRKGTKFMKKEFTNLKNKEIAIPKRAQTNPDKFCDSDSDYIEDTDLKGKI